MIKFTHFSFKAQRSRERSEVVLYGLAPVTAAKDQKA